MGKDYFDDYGEIYEIDMNDEWRNSAYDEEGNTVECDLCGAEMRWNESRHIWVCPECDREMDRDDFFNYIGAEPPGSRCKRLCNTNYPFCKKDCAYYDIPEDDPML